MPSKPRPGVRPIYVELPEDLADQLQLLAERNSRKIKAEVVLAIEAHLAASVAPPVKVPAEAPVKRKGPKPGNKGKGK